MNSMNVLHETALLKRKPGLAQEDPIAHRIGHPLAESLVGQKGEFTHRVENLFKHKR